MILIGFILLCLNLLLLTYRYCYAIYNVQEIILNIHPLYIILMTIMPIIWWLYSTKKDEWHFYSRKKVTLSMVIVNGTMVIGQTIWTFTFDTLVRRICMIPTGRNLDKYMLFILCRIALIGMTGLFMLAIYGIMRKLYENDDIRENIETVRWQHLFDTRTNKDVAYDLKILRRMANGAVITIKEIDRFVHMFILGNSGTGKTSSTLTPSIICDLDIKLKNKLKRIPLLVKFIEDGKGVVVEKEGKNEIDEYNIVPESGYADELEKIRMRYPDCGITTMAPNNSLNDDIIRLAEARNMPINVFDPAYTYKNKNVKMVGINPFYIPRGLDKEQKQVQIKNKAQTFAEVLLAVSEIHGVGDQYFRNINEQVSTNVSIICMLYADLNGRQANISMIQSCISDFGKLKPIVDDIQDKLHMKVVIHEFAKKKDMKKDAKNMDRDSIKAPDFDEDAADDIIFYPITDESEIPEQYKSMGIGIDEYSEMLKKEAEGYAENIHFVKQELLGDGAEEMFSQARGLRNILSNLLLDVRVKRVLSASEENLLDFDRAFANGELTVINTALEFGAQSSTALGLFIMLSMKLAVVRRPKKNRMNHFLYIDEASQYMHPVYEDMFALYRQYKIGVTIAMQSLSQMKKSPITQYLQGVIMGAGIHIVFGRTSAEEMKIYEEMAGLERKETTQTTLNSNSEFDINYNVTKGKRKVVEDKSAVEGTSIRIRDFQEVTVYMIDQGRVLKGIHAKTAFPKKSDFKDKKLSNIDFRKYMDETVGTVIEASKGNLTGKEDISRYKTNHAVSNMAREEDRLSTLPIAGIERKAAYTDKQKQRLGNAAQVLDRVETRKTYSSEEEIDDIELLEPSLMAAKKEDKNNKKPADNTAKKNAKTSKKSAYIEDFDEDINFDKLINSDEYDDDYEDELDEDAILEAEYARLSSERRDY